MLGLCGRQGGEGTCGANRYEQGEGRICSARATHSLSRVLGRKNGRRNRRSSENKSPWALVKPARGNRSREKASRGKYKVKKEERMWRGGLAQDRNKKKEWGELQAQCQPLESRSDEGFSGQRKLDHASSI